MKISKVMLSIIVLFVFSLTSATEAKEAQPEDNPKIVAITMHADWCGTCQELNPKVDNIKSEFEDEAVLFTRFDFTDEYTTKQSRLMANWIGIGELFQASKDRGATGYIIMIDGETHEVIEEITNQKNEDEIRDTIAGLL